MISPRTGAILVLIPFTALTAMAIVGDGTMGFPNAIFHNLTSFQIWLDLVIAVLIWCAWLVPEARAAGRNPWPWIVGALLFGAFSPLIYVAVYQRWPASPKARAAEAPASVGRAAAGSVFALLAALTVAALVADGTNVPAVVTHSWSNIQIWVDLVIMVVFWLAWMFQDARAAGRNPWGWVIFALILGSFSPLLDQMVYGRWPASHPAAVASGTA